MGIREAEGPEWQQDRKKAAGARHAAAGDPCRHRCRQVSASDIVRPAGCSRLIVGCWVLITINTLDLQAFVNCLHAATI